MRYAGKICCECKMPLPPPHRPGERLCTKCSGGSDKRRVYLEFVFKQGWDCRFFEEDLKTALPRRALLKDEKSVVELVVRGGVQASGPVIYDLGKQMRRKRGGIWLELTSEQYAKLKRP
jgi:hypothetical protein